MKTIAVEEQPAPVDLLVQQAASGEEIVFTRAQKPVATLVAISRCASHPSPQFGCLRGKIQLGVNFDAPLEDFADYVP